MAQGGNISLLAPCLEPWNDLRDVAGLGWESSPATTKRDKTSDSQAAARSTVSKTCSPGTYELTPFVCSRVHTLRLADKPGSNLPEKMFSLICGPLLIRCDRSLPRNDNSL